MKEIAMIAKIAGIARIGEHLLPFRFSILAITRSWQFWQL
jgi:transketolase C-terminal domain/subunit